MAERVIPSGSGASDTQTVVTSTEEVDGKTPEDVRSIKLTLKKPKREKQVKWTSETVDNENLNRKKSKCCCIYEKPRNFGESSSEDEGECENCFGHVELKKKPTPPTTPPSEVPTPEP